MNDWTSAIYIFEVCQIQGEADKVDDDVNNPV